MSTPIKGRRGFSHITPESAVTRCAPLKFSTKVSTPDGEGWVLNDFGDVVEILTMKRKIVVARASVRVITTRPRLDTERGMDLS